MSKAHARGHKFCHTQAHKKGPGQDGIATCLIIMALLSDKAVCTFLAHANSTVAAELCPYRLRGSGGVKLEVNVSHQFPDCLEITTALTTLLAVSSCLCQVVACHACTMVCLSLITQFSEHMSFPRFRYIQSRVAPCTRS